MTQQLTKRDVAAAAQALARTSEGAALLTYLTAKYGYTRRATLDENPYRTAFNEGQRSVLIDIGLLLDMDTTPQEDHYGNTSSTSDPDAFDAYTRAVGDGAPDLDGASWGD